jgi:hypothetical protein
MLAFEYGVCPNGLDCSLYSPGADPTENAVSNSTSIVGHNNGNMFTEPLPSNVRLLWLHYSGLQESCHNIFRNCANRN